MKKAVFILSCLAFLWMGGVLTSCQPVNGPEEDDGTSVTPGDSTDNGTPKSSLSTFILNQPLGSAASQTIIAESDWVIRNTCTWFRFTSISGKKGESEISIITNSENPDIMERVDFFLFNTDTVYVVQRGITSSSLREDEFIIPAGTEEFRVPVNGTFPIEDMDISTDVSWAECTGVELAKERKLLDDGMTYSEYTEAVIKLSILEQNLEKNLRTGTLTIVAGKQTLSATMIQLGTGSNTEVDYLKEFYRASVIIKSTGTWCGACPYMGLLIHEVEEDYPDRLYILNQYDNSGDLSSPDGKAIEQHYKVNSWPSTFFNGYAELFPDEEDIVINATTGLMNEARLHYPAKVAIAATSSVSNGKINLSIKLAAKYSKDYKLTVYALENGIKAYQSDYSGLIDSDNYIHNGILRKALTADHGSGGESVDLPLGSVVTKTINVNIPDNIVDINNTDLLIYVTYAGGPDTGLDGVETVKYKDYGYIIDNAVMIPAVNGNIGFRYENDSL